MASTLERATSVPTRCFHCGEANPSRSNWRADIDGRSERFCCAGCLAVAQTIRAAGLSTFYALREEAEPQARNEAPTVSDVPRAHVADVARDIGNGLREMSLLLDGIHCGACVWLIETWLMQQPGIREASVNFATRRARVRFAAADTSPASILRDIGRIGYRAHPYDPGRREALARRESRALLLRMALALLGMMQVMMFAVPAYISVDGVDAEYQALMNWASLVITLPVVLYSGAPFFTGAWRGLRVRRPGMDVPIALGVSGAFVWIFSRGVEARPWVAQGLRFGLAVAFLTVIPTYIIYYVVQPMPGGTVVKQLVFDGILMLLLGVIVAFLYRRGPA